MSTYAEILSAEADAALNEAKERVRTHISAAADEVIANLGSTMSVDRAATNGGSEAPPAPKRRRRRRKTTASTPQQTSEETETPDWLIQRSEAARRAGLSYTEMLSLQKHANIPTQGGGKGHPALVDYRLVEEALDKFAESRKQSA